MRLSGAFAVAHTKQSHLKIFNFFLKNPCWGGLPGPESGFLILEHGSLILEHSSLILYHGSLKLKHGSVKLAHGSLILAHGSLKLEHGSLKTRAWLSKTSKRSKISARHSYGSSQLAGCVEHYEALLKLIRKESDHLPQDCAFAH